MKISELLSTVFGVHPINSLHPKNEKKTEKPAKVNKAFIETPKDSPRGSISLKGSLPEISTDKVEEPKPILDKSKLNKPVTNKVKKVESDGLVQNLLSKLFKKHKKIEREDSESNKGELNESFVEQISRKQSSSKDDSFLIKEIKKDESFIIKDIKKVDSFHKEYKKVESFKHEVKPENVETKKLVKSSHELSMEKKQERKKFFEKIEGQPTRNGSKSILPVKHINTVTHKKSSVDEVDIEETIQGFRDQIINKNQIINLEDKNLEKNLLRKSLLLDPFPLKAKTSTPVPLNTPKTSEENISDKTESQEDEPIIEEAPQIYPTSMDNLVNAIEQFLKHLNDLKHNISIETLIPYCKGIYDINKIESGFEISKFNLALSTATKNQPLILLQGISLLIDFVIIKTKSKEKYDSMNKILLLVKEEVNKKLEQKTQYINGIGLNAYKIFNIRPDNPLSELEQKIVLDHFLKFADETMIDDSYYFLLKMRNLFLNKDKEQKAYRSLFNHFQDLNVKINDEIMKKIEVMSNKEYPIEFHEMDSLILEIDLFLKLEILVKKLNYAEKEKFIQFKEHINVLHGDIKKLIEEIDVKHLKPQSNLEINTTQENKTYLQKNWLKHYSVNIGKPNMVIVKEIEIDPVEATYKDIMNMLQSSYFSKENGNQRFECSIHFKNMITKLGTLNLDSQDKK